MDPINLLVGINLFVTFAAQLGGAKKGIRTSFGAVVERPKTFLQKIPPNLLAIITLLIILSVFKIGTLDYKQYENLSTLRLIGLGMFIVFSWVQIYAYKNLGESYAQEIVILKNHKLVTSGMHKFIRHPQYLSQMLADLGASLALLSYIVFPVVLLLEIPLLFMRANFEDKLLAKHFKNEFPEYKKRSGFLLPFIG